MKIQVTCDQCEFNIRFYADGFILKDWKRYDSDPSALPAVPDNSKFWTYQECKKNSKKATHLNLDGSCRLFSPIK